MHQVVVLSEYVGVPLEIANTGMIAAGSGCGAHDIAFRLPRTCGQVACGIPYGLGTAGGGVGQIVTAPTFVYPRTLLIIVDVVIESDNAVLKRNHVIVEPGIIGMWIAPVHVCLPVVVDEHRRIDVIPVLPLPNERLPQGIAEGAVGGIADEHSYAVSVQRRIEIELSVALHGLYGPCPVLPAAPWEILQRGNGTVLRPVHHVRGGPKQPVVHEETRRASLIRVGYVFGRCVVRGI